MDQQDSTEPGKGKLAELKNKAVCILAILLAIDIMLTFTAEQGVPRQGQGWK